MTLTKSIKAIKTRIEQIERPLNEKLENNLLLIAQTIERIETLLAKVKDKEQRLQRLNDGFKSLLTDVKNELETLCKESPTQPKKRRVEEPLPSEEHLRVEYQRLYETFTATNSSQAVEGFVKGKKKTYLNAFCKANSLPVNVTKVSKNGIIDLIMQWMAQRKAITKKAT